LGSSCFVRTWRTIRLVGVDNAHGQVFVQFIACSCTFVVRSVGRVVFRCMVFADRPPGACGPSAQHELLADHPRVGYGPSVFLGAVLVVRVSFLDRPPRPRGPFACSLRIVRQDTADHPLQALQIAEVLCFLSCASVLL
jgi:hypothetical protein